MEFLEASSDLVCSSGSKYLLEKCVSYNNDCSSYYSALPTIQLIIDGTFFTIPPEGYTLSHPNPINPSSPPMCEILIYPGSLNTTMIIGELFFTQYAV